MAKPLDFRDHSHLGPHHSPASNSSTVRIVLIVLAMFFFVGCGLVYLADHATVKFVRLANRGQKVIVGVDDQ